jgi:prepilin-type processing-associated H-X9-DG protein
VKRVAWDILRAGSAGLNEQERLHGSRNAVGHASAFTRIDLIVTLALAVLFGGWFVVNHTGERGRIAGCARNLKVLGQAILSEADDHGNELVPAELNVGKIERSWDTELFPYLNPSLGRTTDPEAKEQLFSSVSPRFQCPSDTLLRRAPRTYTMPSRNMTLGWPPTPDDETGVGVFWNKQTIASLLGEEAWPAALARPETLERLKLSVLPVPAATLVLTELVARRNIVKHTGWARVASAARRQAVFEMDPSRFHFGRFNYLMSDGHVEWLSDLQVGGNSDAPSGIWTIKGGDRR